MEKEIMNIGYIIAKSNSKRDVTNPSIRRRYLPSYIIIKNHISISKILLGKKKVVIKFYGL